MTANVSQIHEYQLLSAIAKDRDLMAAFPEARQYLALSESQHLYDAIRLRNTDDPAILATTMTQNGHKATPEFLSEKIFSVGKNWPADDIVPTIEFLRECWQKRESLEFIESIRRQLAAGEIDPLKAAEMFDSRMNEISDMTAESISSIDQWELFGPIKALERKEMFSKDKYLKMPIQLPSLRNNVIIESDILILLTGPTGGGKSSLAWQMANSMIESGDNVLYVDTELTKAQRMWRNIAMKTGVSFRELSRGYWDERCSNAVKWVPGHGKIIHLEAGGMNLQTILASAKRFNAHIIIDYWDMVSQNSIRMLKGLTMTKTDVIGEGLKECKAYAQHQKRTVMVVQQYGKSGAENGPMDSARFEHRANLWVQIDLKKVEPGMPPMLANHPFERKPDGKPIIISTPVGRLNPFGNIVISKDTFGDAAGLTVPTFMYGGRFMFVELAQQNIAPD